MKLSWKPKLTAPRTEQVSRPRSPPRDTSASRPSRTEAPSSPTSAGRRQDGFDVGGPSRVRPRRPSNDGTERVRGPDAGEVKKPKTNADIRKWYNDKVNTIPELDKKWAAEGVPLEERARRAVAIRHDARLEARKMMSSPLEVAMLRARDFFTYGSIHGPSFDQLVKKAEAKGLQGDAVWKELIGSANRTNQTVNQHFLGTPQARL